MLQSKLFTKTRKDAPKDEVSKNAELLIRAGFIHKEMAGVYDYLPLGLRVLKKIENIIREEMNAVGGQEIEMTTLQDPELWKKADKWDDEKVDVWFKTKLKNESELGLAFSHEEVILEMLRNHMSSYKDLPLYVYQFQTKFRNELRAKSGIMRGREFYMKDMYSFSRSEEELMEFYEKAKEAYWNVMKRAGLEDCTYLTRANGSVFGPWSDEFQVVSEVGEDLIYADESKKIAINKEVYNDENIELLGLNKTDLVEKKAIEAGNIFPIGDMISKKMNFTFKDEEGNSKSVFMGSYGIGLGRLMGTVVEVLSDEKGIIWPESIAPYKFHLIEIAPKEGKGVRTEAEKVYSHLQNEGIEVLFDDREMSAGAKFADSDLIGIPYRLIVSEKTIERNKIELTDRKTGETKDVTLEDLVSL